MISLCVVSHIALIGKDTKCFTPKHTNLLSYIQIALSIFMLNLLDYFALFIAQITKLCLFASSRAFSLSKNKVLPSSIIRAL